MISSKTIVFDTSVALTNIRIFNGEEEPKEEKEEMAEKKERTVKDVYDEMTDEQKKVVAFLVGEAVADAEGGDDDEDVDEVRLNVRTGNGVITEYIVIATAFIAIIAAGAITVKKCVLDKEF